MQRKQEPVGAPLLCAAAIAPKADVCSADETITHVSQYFANSCARSTMASGVG